MATKKFKTETEYNAALQKLEYKSSMYHSRLEEVFNDDFRNVMTHTIFLVQAEQLMELVIEKIKQHNAECKRQATVMKGKAYKRNNIQNYQY
jgi:hypothetical protein